MKNVILIVLALGFIGLMSCEKKQYSDESLLIEANYRGMNTTNITFDGNLIPMNIIGEIHNSTLDSFFNNFDKIDGYYYKEISNSLDAILSNTMLNYTIDLNIENKLSLDSFVLMNDFIAGLNDNISYINSIKSFYLDSLISMGIINLDEKTLLSNFISDLLNPSNSIMEIDSIYNVRFQNLNSINNYSKCLVGTTLSVGIHSYNFWNEFNTNFPGLDSINDDDINTFILRDAIGAWVGSLFFTYDHRDCLDWGCGDDAGEELGKYALRGAISGSIGYGVGKILIP